MRARLPAALTRPHGGLTSRRVVVVVVVLALVGVLAVAGVVAWRRLHRSDYQQALAWLPASTLRASYTDWARVRAIAHGRGLDAGSGAHAVQRFLDRAYDRDLTSASALRDSTTVLERRFGFSPLNARWEMFGQSRTGAVAVVRLTDGVDMSALEPRLRRLGYRAPGGGTGSGGVWRATPDRVARIDARLTPVEQNVVVLPGQHAVLLSDTASYAASSADVVTGDADGLLGSVSGVSSLAGLGSPPSAVLFASDFACTALSMTSAGKQDRSLARGLVSGAGGVAPLEGLVMMHQRGGSLLVGMHFESAGRAERNLAARVRLASGQAPGQGGSFRDRFRVAAADTDGDDVVLRLRPRHADAALLSDLSNGPLLFATC